jgi:hypothetical protein
VRAVGSVGLAVTHSVTDSEQETMVHVRRFKTSTTYCDREVACASTALPSPYTRSTACTPAPFSAKIRYQVKAECEVPGILTPNIRTKQHIILNERMAKPPSESDTTSLPAHNI